jgi:hypothetical protein
VGVAVYANVERNHGIENAGIDWSSGLHIKVNGSLSFLHDSGRLEDL